MSRGAADRGEIDRTECLRLLAGGAVGRVVFTDAALPAALPVGYVLVGEEIVFRTPYGSRLAVAVVSAVVGFQVDDLDADTRQGWSVVGVGQAYEVIDARLLAMLPWTGPDRGHVVAVPMECLSGSRMQAVARRPSRTPAVDAPAH
jgi:nitroimidazol reductase NimA-like FMN-containing flavoprotein (pyridoxamine 5'-phosphate oxidase superfamily)